MIGRTNFDFDEKLLFEHGSKGRCGVDLPAMHLADDEVRQMLGEHERLLPNEPLLPECSEPEINRHYTRLSRWNFSIDTNSYPLGSCTMKYNPRINEWAGRLPGFSQLHPYLPKWRLKNAFYLMSELEKYLGEIGGFSGVSLQPAAGAHGEFAGVMMIDKALKARGESRTKMLVPHSAHGTNPASAAFFGYEIVTLESGADGLINLEELKSKMDNQCAGIMITNPNTLGLFEKNISEICQVVHEHGGFVYGDGANLNALMGIVRPGDCGIDVMHFNLHKTFTTPHGGGGPGCGAVGVCEELKKFLPEAGEQSIGRIRSFYGNFGMMVRAFTYMREMGPDGLKKASEMAVLNANYVKALLRPYLHLPYETDCLHEVVFTDKKQSAQNISTLDIAKGLIDKGIHPPTVYFPLVVSGAMMIEPTETESKEDLDRLCEAFIEVLHEDSAKLKISPTHTALGRLNEAKAARNPILVFEHD
ncbi:MAG: aminomethyl-transferring glycine dehydrogenase subunit GcvPB [Myxococcota bacterium]